MASNKITRTYNPLVQLGEDAADGAATHGAAIGMAQHTEPKIRAVLETVVGKPAGPGGTPPAVPGLKGLLNAALANKVQKTALRNSARSNGRALAGNVVTVLKPRLGKEWSADWKAVGFTTGNLSIPDNPLTILQQSAAYFVQHPTHEVLDLIPGIVPPIAVTAASCNAAAQAITNATSQSNQSNTDVAAARQNLDAGLSALRKRLSGLLNELGDLLDDNDPRWYAFGFERPSDPETGNVPENVVVAPGAAGSGRIFVDWDDARRAEKYRATVTNTANPRVVLATKIVEESEATFDGLPAGASVLVNVTTLNDAGESQSSGPASGIVP
jgi:hypothetical protein